MFVLSGYSQVGVGANFGIESDAYSGDVTSGINTDDWFYNNVSGAGVVDEATAITMGYAAQLAAGNNIAFDLRQSIPNYASNNGYIWYSTRYGRDYTNASSLDVTTFTGGKNGDNPMTSWGSSPGSVPAKTDIVDSGVHMRRNGVLVTDDLWVDLMISTLSATGNHFVDFELFVSEIAISGSSFVNSGSQEGHTAWTFDASGNVTNIGDMVIGFSYGGGGVSGLEIRLWVDRAIFNPGSSPGGTSTFTWGGSIDGGSTYGYAQIVVPPGALLNNVNTLATSAPPWGTTDTSGYTANYGSGYLAEVGVNFTQLGFDPRALFGSGAACDSPFSAIMAKSRTSSSFTSSLKDFAGPYDFLGSAAGTQVNTTITDPGDFDSCNTGETLTLQAEFISASSEYVWYSLTPGVVFPANGLSEISGVGMDNVVIDTVGDYQLGIAPLQGCTPSTEPTDILTISATPCAFADAYSTAKDVTLNVSAINGLLANDVDNDPSDVLTVNTTPLSGTSNGVLTLNADGSFSYVPNAGYVGADSFTYQVCDSFGGCDTASASIIISDDSDGDSIPDKTDLDDDNDGIPDSEELNTIANNSQPPCGGETVLDFSTAAVLESGTALQQGAVYRIANVTSGTDALVTIVQTVNATVANIDNNSSDPASFKPQTAFNFPNVGDQGYIEYNIQFVNSGGSTPVVLPKFFMNFNDIDGGANYGEQNWADNPSTYTISNPTDLTMTNDGSWLLGTAGLIDYPGAGNGNPQANFSVNYNSKSEMSIRVGAVARVAGASSGGRQHAIEFNCITNYVSPVTYGIDTDSDGVANHLDLDADNDGIYDAVEAGHNRAHLNGIVISSFGLNGLADLVETVPESGTLNYTITDTDGNSPPNYLDTDSDDDGCSDANEAYADANADGGDDEYYGLGNPPPVDAQGRVSAATYPVPADIGSNGTLDYVEAESPPVITTQPADITVCPGCNTSLTVIATGADTYQWQQFIGAVWVDMTDTGIYSGTTTNTLVLTNATTAEDGTQYRAVLTNLSYVCGNSTTNTVTVTVNVSTVISNKRITYRVNKN
jgi:hypothetical protein